MKMKMNLGFIHYFVSYIDRDAGVSFFGVNKGKKMGFFIKNNGSL